MNATDLLDGAGITACKILDILDSGEEPSGLVVSVLMDQFQILDKFLTAGGDIPPRWVSESDTVPDVSVEHLRSECHRMVELIASGPRQTLFACVFTLANGFLELDEELRSGAAFPYLWVAGE